MNTNDKLKPENFTQATWVSTIVDTFNKHSEALSVVHERLDKAKKFVFGAGILAIVSLLIGSFALYKATRPIDTDGIAKTVLKQVPPAKDYSPEIAALKAAKVTTDEKMAMLVGNPALVAELTKKIDDNSSNRDIVDKQTSARLDKVEGESRSISEIVKNSLDEFRQELKNGHAPVDVSKPETVEGTHTAESTSGTVRLEVVEYDPARHHLAKENTPGSVKFNSGADDPKDVSTKAEKAKAMIDGKVQIVMVRKVLCADGITAYRGGGAKPILKDTSLTAVEMDLEETVIDAQKNKKMVFLPYWVVPAPMGK